MAALGADRVSSCDVGDMTLDVIVPTYNRSALLLKTLISLAAASVPTGLAVTVLVVDNNSTDDTASVVKKFAATSPVPVRYVPESRQGLSNARNGGIAASHAELIGFIDDDEEIDPSWYRVVAREFADPAIQFIGGPYLPNWVCPIPDWLPPGYHAAIGAIPPKPRGPFSAKTDANLMGGNAVLRRSVFSAVGPYAPHLGRSKKGLLSEEDAEFYRRLRKHGIHGMYVPDLAILHYIAPERLTHRYHRRWVFWRGVSQGVLDRETQEAVPYLFGVPRYKLGRALRALVKFPFQFMHSGNPGQRFARELSLWDLAGFAYGKYLFRTSRYYAQPTVDPSPAKSDAAIVT